MLIVSFVGMAYTQTFWFCKIQKGPTQQHSGYGLDAETFLVLIHVVKGRAFICIDIYIYMNCSFRFNTHNIRLAMFCVGGFVLQLVNCAPASFH